MQDWTFNALGLEHLEPAAREKLSQLSPVVLSAGHVLFRPGDEVSGFVMALSGRVGVYLTGTNGRELLLYSVAPGETCVQTTMGLLGDQRYTGEAIAESDISVVMVPRDIFTDLMASSQGFRNFVFRAFADRLHTVMDVLKKVAFVTVEARLAQTLLERAQDREVRATHQELATIIGTSREVVSRRLEILAKAEIVSQDRGVVRIVDRQALVARTPQKVTAKK